MKTTFQLIIFLFIISNPIFGQLECNFNIISEIHTEEEMFFVETIFGDGEKKKYRNRIISKTKEKEKLKLSIGVKSMEKGKLFCESEISNDTLKLQFRVKGKVIDERGELVEIGASKYREVEIEINNLNVIPEVILLNGEEIEETKELYLTFPIQFEIVDGDTINRKDKFGQRQGKWVVKMYSTITESFYKDSKLIEATMTKFYASNNIESEYFYNPTSKVGDVYFRNYFETGEIQEENYQIKETGIFKKKWGSNGVIIQENFYNGEQIEMKQYDKNGKIDCKCKTDVGAESFKGMIICWTTNEFKIPCIFYDDNGKEITKGEKQFKLNYEINPRK